MAQTLDELNADLLKISTAITDLATNNRVSEFRIGSGSSLTVYKFGEVTLEALQKERTRILGEISQLSSLAPSFRTSSVMRTVYSKIN